MKFLNSQDAPSYDRFTEEEITEQAMALVLGALDQLPPARREQWLQNFVRTLDLIANPNDVLADALDAPEW